MIYIYFDDSVHDRGGFVMGGCVIFDQSPDTEIDRALLAAGLVPGTDEFKSANRFAGNPHLVKLRDDLFSILEGGTIALTIVDRANRSSLGIACLDLLAQLLERVISPDEQISVFIDEGIVSRTDLAKHASGPLLSSRCVFHPDADSAVVRGIQLADLLAHSASQMLLEHLGLQNKECAVTEAESGYPDGTLVSIGFEMFARLRYRWATFRADVHSTDNHQEDISEDTLTTHDVSQSAIFVSESVSQEIRDAFKSRFGSVYIGCIH